MTCPQCGCEFVTYNFRRVHCSIECRRSITLEERLWEKVVIGGPNDCWLWIAGLGRSGYPSIQIDGKTHRVSRIIWEMKIGPLSSKEWVLHGCDNPPCCNPAHYFKGDHLANTADKMAKGCHRGARGESCRRHILISSQVQEVRTLYATNQRTVAEMAAQFKVCVGTIKAITQNLNWKHLPWPEGMFDLSRLRATTTLERLGRATHVPA